MATALDQSPRTLIAAPTLLEAPIVAQARLGTPGAGNLQAIVKVASVEVVDFGDDLAHIAIEAWRRFGMGRHRAGLNLGDCMAYATTAAHDAPLLFVGADFAQTDAASAI